MAKTTCCQDVLDAATDDDDAAFFDTQLYQITAGVRVMDTLDATDEDAIQDLKGFRKRRVIALLESLARIPDVNTRNATLDRFVPGWQSNPQLHEAVRKAERKTTWRSEEEAEEVYGNVRVGALRSIAHYSTEKLESEYGKDHEKVVARKKYFADKEAELRKIVKNSASHRFDTGRSVESSELLMALTRRVIELEDKVSQLEKK